MYDINFFQKSNILKQETCSANKNISSSSEKCNMKKNLSIFKVILKT